MHKQSLLKLFFALIFTIVLYWLVIQFRLTETINFKSIEALVARSGAFGPIVFALVYYCITLLFISAAALSVLAGTLFGKLLGTILVIISATLAAQTAFFVARYFGTNILTKIGTQSGVVQKLITYVQTGVSTNGFRFFFIMRCLFVPYIPVSYAAGLVPKAKPWDFFGQHYLPILFLALLLCT